MAGLYADDILLVATSYEELRSKIRDVQHVLAPLGLQLAWDKCKLLRSPSVPKQVLQIEGQCIEHVVGHGLSSLMTLAALAARTVRATNSFYAHYKLLTEATVSLTDRLHMLGRHATSMWRWMAPAIRPVQETCNHLLRLSTDFLMRMVQLARDEFIGAADWVARRRAAKVAAQQCGFISWSRILWSRYLSCWGHAADSSSSYGSDFEPQGMGSWQIAAQNRDAWCPWSEYVMREKGFHKEGFYRDVTAVDLHGRCVVRHQSGFHLLLARLQPVETRL